MDILQKIKKHFTKKETFEWYFALIYLLIVTIPFNHKEAFSIYDPDLVWSKYTLAALAAVGVYFLAKSYKTYIRDPFFLFLLSFAGFQTLSLLQSGDINSSLQIIAFQLAVAFTYIPVRNFIFARKDSVKELIILYGAIFVPVVLFLFYQIYLQENFQIAIGGVWPVPAYPTRYGATFWDINHFGIFCTALSLILIGFLLQKGVGRKTKIFSGIILCATLFALNLTGSRSSAIGFVVGLITFAILLFNTFKFKLNRKFHFGVFYCAVLFSVSGFLYFLYFAADSLKASLLYRSVSFFSHLFLLKVGIIVGLQNFLLGIGANSFHAYFRNTEWADIYYYIDRAALDLKLPLHNLWLEVLAETGLVALIVFTSFWILLLVGLYRVYRENNDRIALGFIGAIVAFLVAGFMYSYKSEFFWMFVLIAASYVSKSYFEGKRNIISAIKNVLCPGNCDVQKIVLVGLSVFTLLVPVIFMTHTLNPSEIKLFNLGYEPNLLADKYMQLLVLIKYIIGNYTYTGRILSFVFYFGSVALLFLILKRYLGGLYALVFTAIIFGVANIFEPNMVVSIKYFVTFALLAVAGFFILLFSFINRQNEMFDLSKVLPKSVLIAFVSVIISVGFVANNVYFSKGYNNDLTFLLELAYNRRLLDKSLIQVSKDIDLEFVYYFSDEVRRNDKGLYSAEGDVLPAEDMGVDRFNKILFVFTDAESETIYDITEKLEINPEDEITELGQGDYNLLLIEKKPEAQLMQ